MRRINKGEVIAWNDVCDGHVGRDADQRNEESCEHGKVILILSYLARLQAPRATTGNGFQLGRASFTV